MTQKKRVDREISSSQLVSEQLKSFALNLPDPDDVEGIEEEQGVYQLQLRVNDAAYSYMENLAAKAECETISELVRKSLIMLENATSKFDIVRRADGFEIGRGAEVSDNTGVEVISILQPPPTRRLNIVLRNSANNRLKRLLELSGGASLANIVMTGLGVIHTVLNDGSLLKLQDDLPGFDEIEQQKAEFDRLLEEVPMFQNENDSATRA